jgi:hypothetical protein
MKSQILVNKSVGLTFFTTFAHAHAEKDVPLHPKIIFIDMNFFKTLKTIPLLLPAMLVTGACSDEPANMECDVETIWLEIDDPSSVFDDPSTAYTYLDYMVSTEADGLNINWEVKPSCELGAYPVCFTLTPGATAYIYDENGARTLFRSGDVVDFSDERKTIIEVVSQDGAWSKRYSLSMYHRQISTSTFTFDFNEGSHDLHLSAKGDPGNYYKFKPTDPQAIASLFRNPDDPYWKNGNPGFAISRSSATPDQYPTTVAFGAGPDGSDCVLMQTVSTGGIGAMAKIYIAAGSLFDGEFNAQKAMKSRSAARTATQFGVPFDRKPISMTVDMKYIPGPAYWNEDKVVQPAIVDEPDAYLVFYRNDGGLLDGYNVLTSPKIIGKGRLKHNLNPDGSDCPGSHPIHGLSAEWKTVKLDVEYPNGDPDPEILKNMGYSLIIGFSSSWQGADFRGALDSKLYIDNIVVECEGILGE